MLKKIRNQVSTGVNKYKEKLAAIGISYDDKFAKVEVPNPATGGTQHLRWDWLTSTTNSHLEQVAAFKNIIEALEAKSNPEQYKNLVSRFDASTKNALESTIKSHNITVPNLNENVEEVNQKDDNISSTSEKGLDNINTDQNITSAPEILLEKEINDAATTSSLETSKVLLGEKIKLTNGAEFETKSILKDLSDKGFINMILDRVTPEIRGFLEKEMVLKTVYNVNQGQVSKKDAGNIISSFDCLSMSNTWLEYNGLTNEEITAKEVEITGGASYLGE